MLDMKRKVAELFWLVLAAGGSRWNGSVLSFDEVEKEYLEWK